MKPLKHYKLVDNGPDGFEFYKGTNKLVATYDSEEVHSLLLARLMFDGKLQIERNRAPLAFSPVEAKAAIAGRIDSLEAAFNAYDTVEGEGYWEMMADIAYRDGALLPAQAIRKLKQMIAAHYLLNN